MLGRLQSLLLLIPVTILAIASNEVVANDELGTPVGEELILEVHAERYYLSELIAVKQEKGALVSLEGLADAVRFPITVDYLVPSAEGWFFSEDKLFTLRLGADQRLYVSVDGEEYIHEAGTFLVSTDLYVSPELIETWFGISIDFNFLQSSMTLKSATPLPFVVELQRQKRRVSNTILASKPLHQTDYELWTLPNSHLRMNYLRLADSDNVSASLQGANDLLYHSSSYSLNVSNLTDDPELTGFLEFDKNLLLSEDSSEDKNITQYRFGDIIVANAGISRGVGVEITNRTNQAYTDSDSIIVEGIIPEGWDVELYRNNILINNQLAVTGGRFVFEDVQLFFGVNEIKTILYGPEGQVREDKKLYKIDEHKSDNSYSLSIQKSGTQILNNLNNASESGYVINGNLLTKALFGQPINIDMQLFDNEETDELRQRYSMSTVFRAPGESIVNLRYSFESDIERSLGTSLNSSFLGQGLNLTVEYGENLVVNDSALSWGVKLAGPIIQGNGWGISHQTSYDIRPSSDNFFEETRRFSNSLSFFKDRYHISHRISLQDTENEEELLNGSVQINMPVLGSKVRGSLTYSGRTDTELESATLGFDKYLFDKFNFSTDATHNFITDAYSARTSLAWLQDDIWWSSTLNYNSETGFIVGVSAQVGLGINTLNNTTYTSNRNLTYSGSQIVRVFEDRNYNGIYDPSDVLVEGAVIKLPQFSRTGKTDTHGIAIFESLPSGHSDLVVDPASIPDPFLKPTIGGFSIKPRRGITGTMDFPLVRTAEVEGVIKGINKQGVEYDAGGIKVELINKQGKVAATTQSSIDGFYLISDIMPGSYTLSIAEDSIKRKKLRKSESIEVSLEPESITEINLQVAKKQEQSRDVVVIGQFSSQMVMNLYSNRVSGTYINAFGNKISLIHYKEGEMFKLFALPSGAPASLEQIQANLLKIGVNSQIEELNMEL